LAAGGAVASAAGPVLGGVLSTWDWRLIFAINVPVCAFMLILAARVQRSPRTPARFDWTGQFLALVGLGSIIYALIEGGVVGYLAPMIVVLLIVGVCALGLFLLVQARSDHPMVPLRIFRSRPMRVAMFGGFAFIFAWFGSVFVASLYLQQELNIPPALAGLVFLPGAAVALVGNLGSGPLVNRFGPRFPVILGMASLVLGLAALALSVHVGSAVLVGVTIAMIGGGGSVAMPPLAGVVLERAPHGQAGVASAVSNTFRQVGGALAVALFGVLVSYDGGFIIGMQISLAIGALLALIGLLASLTLEGPGASATRE
jgi:DHA2 family methylenomycin A resistance protein-like MFS transporter